MRLSGRIATRGVFDRREEIANRREAFPVLLGGPHAGIGVRLV